MGTSGFTGQNPPAGAVIAYLLNELPDGAAPRLEIVDAGGTVIRQLPANRTPSLYRAVWDFRAGAPLTGPVAATPPAGRGGREGGAGAPAGRGGGGEITFVAMPGAYRARLTIAPASGSPTVLEQPFAVHPDAAVILTGAELRQLNATRLAIARLQAGLRETQARLDTVQRQLGEARRAADSSSATPAAAKEQLAALETEVASIVAQLGGAPGAGRGGAAGAGGRGGRAGGAGGRGGGADDDDQQAPPPPPPTQTVQAWLGTLSELMSGQFNPSPDQRRAVQELPAALRREDERVQRIQRDRLPALQQALRTAGVLRG